jgi:PKD repeat protein
MKTKLCLLVVFSVLFAILSATVLDFPLSVQEQTNWCWAGATQSIFHYYDLPITQTEIAQYGTEGQNNWNWLFGESVLPTRKGINLILDHFAGLQTVFGDSLSAIPMSQVITEIDSMQPFVTRIGYTTGGGHFIDCYGYSGNNLYQMDPWPGNGYTISDYDWFHNGSPDFTWTHTLMINSGVGLRAYFTANPNVGYAPLNATFTDFSLNTPTAWAWDFNNDGVSESNEQNPTWSFPIHSVYTIALTVTKGSETHTYTNVNCINSLDNPPAVVNSIPDLELDMNTPSVPINLNEVFIDIDNDPISFTFNNATNHISGTIENGILTLTPNQDWTGTTTCFVRCTDEYAHIVNDIFRVTVRDSTSSAEDNVTNQMPALSVYPNPFSLNTSVKVSNPTNQTLALKVFNSKGQKLKSWTVPAHTKQDLAFELEVEGGKILASGVYLVIMEGKGYHITKKALYLKP